MLAILWFIRFVAALHHPVRRLLIIQEAVVAIGMTLLAISPLPRNIRFRLSEPALTAYLRQPHEGEHITVGLYKFRSIENTEEGWLFNLEDTALTQEGFLYHTGPAPKNDKLYLHKRLSGSWYLWTYDAF